MPATPMKEAALRYSPEMALAFHPTLTLRPATKKSLAVLEVLAERKPIQIVAMTVRALKARIQGSMVIRQVGKWESGKVGGTPAGNFPPAQLPTCSISISFARRSLEQPRLRTVAHVHKFAKDAVKE